MKKTKFREKEDMLQTLLSVSDNEQMVQRFYPLLLNSAGEDVVDEGVSMALYLAIMDYSRGMSPNFAEALLLRKDEFIDALVADHEVAEAAKGFFDENMIA